MPPQPWTYELHAFYVWERNLRVRGDAAGPVANREETTAPYAEEEDLVQHLHKIVQRLGHVGPLPARLLRPFTFKVSGSLQLAGA